MIRRHVLAALGVGVVAGDDDSARAEVARVDWILRGQVRRRLETALIDASLATGVLDDGDREAARHRLRAAALIVRGEHDLDLADRDEIASAFAHVATPVPLARVPVVTILAAIVGAVLVIGGLGAVVQIVTGGGAVGTYQRPTPPAPVGAFRDGGVPVRDAGIEHVLAVELPHLVASDSSGGRAERVAALRDHAAFARHGVALSTAWRDMIDHLGRWMAGAPSDPAFRALSSELRARVDVVSDQLAAARLGYFVDAAILVQERHRREGLTSYRIDEVSFVRADAERVRVLGVRRLHHLDERVALLGLMTEEVDDPVVLLDQVDAKVTSQILPVLGGQAYPIGDGGWTRTQRGRTIALAAGDAIRRELHTALGFDVGSYDLATARCRRLVTASVRHHEAQHALDHDRKLPYPTRLAAAIGEPASSPFAIRARFELSAYLSQIASDTWLPQLVLWNLARHAFRQSPSRVAESYVAAVVIEGLARHLRIRSPGPVVQRGVIDRERLAALVAPLAERSTTELRGAAAALWAELFERRLVRLNDDDRPRS